MRQADEFYPLLETFAQSMQTTAGDYAIEGVAFLPRHADRLRASVSLRACFLGWSEVDLRSMTTHAGRNDWLAGMDDTFREEFPGHSVELSRLLERECREFGFPYVDVAGDFSAKLAAAADMLVCEANR